MARVRSKRWSFTLNNPTEAEESMLQGLVSSGQATYIIFGKETGESGTFHFQGYLEVDKKLSLSSVKQLIPRAHLEKSRGSSQSNRDYCTKEDSDAFEAGSPMQQGKRTDLEEIKKLLDDGQTSNMISESHFSQWVVYRRSFQAYAALKKKKRNWVTKVVVIWGLTGTGKTRLCFEQCGDDEIPWLPGDFQWFDGYDGQRHVIIDDFRGEYPLPLLLKLLDRYPMRVPIKGGFVNWAPETVYITSNIDPDHWYQDAAFESRRALRRRFTEVKHVTQPLYDDIVLFE